MENEFQFDNLHKKNQITNNNELNTIFNDNELQDSELNNLELLNKANNDNYSNIDLQEIDIKNLNELEIIKQIGKGGFSKTYLAKDLKGNNYAIKKILIDKTDLRLLDIIDREIGFIKKISHPNIPKFYTSFKNNIDKFIEISIIQEYIDGKNLYELISEGKTFIEKEVIDILIKASKIIDFLHNFNPTVIHRDIKPSNIMIDNTGKVYLIDFGAIKEKVSFEYTSKSGLSTIIGTQGYMPIEQFENRVNLQSDIYSLGLTAIYLLSKKEPLEFPKNGLNINFKKYVNISENFYNILNKMVEPDYTDRYKSVSELKKDLYNVEEKKIIINKTPLYNDEILKKYLEEDEEILLVEKPEINSIVSKKGVLGLILRGVGITILSIFISFIFIFSLNNVIGLYNGIGSYIFAVFSILLVVIASGFLLGIGALLTPYFSLKYSRETKYILTSKKIIVLPKFESINRSLFSLPLRIIKLTSKYLIIFGNTKEVVNELPTVIIRIFENNIDPDEINYMESKINNVKLVFYHDLKNYSIEKIQYKDGSGDLIFYKNSDRNKQIYMKLISVKDINVIERFIIDKFKDN